MLRLLALLCACLIASLARAEDLNALILEQVRNMPSGGSYSVSHFAQPRPEKSTSSFLSSATGIASTDS